MESIERTRGERREGVVVSVPGPDDEVSLHRKPERGGRQPRLPIMSGAATKSFHFQPARWQTASGAKDGTTSAAPDSYRAEAPHMPALSGGREESLPRPQAPATGPAGGLGP